MGFEIIQTHLFALRDARYQAFHSRLMPTAAPETVIGVRLPALRKLAKALRGTEAARAFLNVLPHQYYEENNLHGLLICALPEYGETVAALDRFLPFVDNWATCDLLRPKAFAGRPPPLPDQLRIWLCASHEYTVRFALEMLMTLYLDEAFDPAFLDLAAGIQCGAYYVNMMRAWYFATALAKQYDAALPYLEQRRLDHWTHHKTIQKAIESKRIPPARKEWLKSLRSAGF